MRWSLASVARLAIGVGALGAALVGGALAARPVSGRYAGEYTCAQGLTGMTLFMRMREGGRADALVIFYAHPRNPGVASGCYTSAGVYDARSGHLHLTPRAWIVRPGPDWFMTEMDGRIDAARGAFTGREIYPPRPGDCSTFTLKLNARPVGPAPKACTLNGAVS